jgi:hypothetical protein
MTLFELLFALSTVILGLALTNIAGSLHRLALAGRRIRWAPEPLLLAALITTIIIQVWLDQWFLREMKTLVYGAAALTIVRLMTIFFAAASCLPEADLLGDGPFDLKEYYYRTRALTYGAMITGLVLFAISNVVNGDRNPAHFLIGGLVGPVIYGLLIWTKRPWVHLLVLTALLAGWAGPTLMLDIKA